MHLQILSLIALTFFRSSFCSTDLLVPQVSNGCETRRDEWGCCEFVPIINSTVCIEFRVLREALGVDFRVTYDNKTVIDEEISLRNPPAACADVPYLEKWIKGCVRMYNFVVTEQRLNGCFRLEAKVIHYGVEIHELGCFSIPYRKYGVWVVIQANVINDEISKSIRMLNSSNTMRSASLAHLLILVLLLLLLK